MVTYISYKVQGDKINNKIWKIARFVAYFAQSFSEGTIGV